LALWAILYFGQIFFKNAEAVLIFGCIFPLQKGFGNFDKKNWVGPGFGATF
jgi:hypothetical protein